MNNKQALISIARSSVKIVVCIGIAYAVGTAVSKQMEKSRKATA